MPKLDRGSDAVYRIELSTTRQMVLQGGLLKAGPVARFIMLTRAAVPPSDRAAKHVHHLPARSNGTVAVPLVTRLLSSKDLEGAGVHPFERPFQRVLVYWGCEEAQQESHPRVFDATFEDDVALTAKLAPRPRSRESQHTGRGLVALQDIHFPEELQVHGSHALHVADRVSRFEIQPQSGFLDPVDISRVWMSDTGAIRLEWRGQAAAAAHFVTAFIHEKLSPEVVIWTSSKAPEAGWLLAASHPGAQNFARLLDAGILLDPRIETCTVPARVVRHASNPMLVQVHAYSDDKHVPHSNSGPPIAEQIRLARHAKTSVLIFAAEGLAHARSAHAKTPRESSPFDNARSARASSTNAPRQDQHR